MNENIENEDYFQYYFKLKKIIDDFRCKEMQNKKQTSLLDYCKHSS